VIVENSENVNTRMNIATNAQGTPLTEKGIVLMANLMTLGHMWMMGGAKCLKIRAHVHQTTNVWLKQHLKSITLIVQLCVTLRYPMVGVKAKEIRE
tara:strand:+ start:1989 stop:2276 length:288 start_codon:yes stop_codon:yes gene_type:complete